MRYMPLVKYEDPQANEETSAIPAPFFTAVFWGLFFAASISICIFYLMTRPVVITSAGVSEEAPLDMDRMIPLSLSGLPSAGIVNITVPEGTGALDIVTENLYNERRFLVHINTESDSFYGLMTASGVPLDAGMISGNESYVENVGVVYDRSGALLVFDMQKVSEYVLTMEENKVIMEAVSPGDMYDFVVVADPESDEAAGVSRDVSERCALLARDRNIKVYITDREKEAEGGITPAELMNETDADIYIGLGVSHDGPGHHGMSAFYDPLYYIPGFGSVDLSDCVLKNAVISSSNKALAVSQAPSGSTLYSINAPATFLILGNADDSRENDLLREDAYRDRIAKGLFDAITYAETAMNN